MFEKCIYTNLGSRNSNLMKKIGLGPSGGKFRTGPSTKLRNYGNVGIDSDSFGVAGLESGNIFGIRQTQEQ